MARNRNLPRGASVRATRPGVLTTEANSAKSRSSAAVKGDPAHQSEHERCGELPIDSRDTEIRELAHRKWEVAGRPAGNGIDFWLEAESEVRDT